MIEKARAIAALRVAKQDPSKFSTDELEMLIASAEQPDPKPSNFGEGGSMFGDTGMDVLEKRITSPEQHAQVEKARGVSPAIAKALGVGAGGAAPVIPDESPEEKLEREKKEYLDAHDPSLPTASKRKDLYAPAEHLPEQFGPEAPPALDPMGAFAQKVDQARGALPAFAGGKVEHFLEPPVSQFRREMRPILGDVVDGMGVGSDAYREYADQLWKGIYDKARAEGRAVIRTAYKDDRNGNAPLWAKAAEQGLGALGGVDTVLAGIPSDTVDVLRGRPFMGDQRESMKAHSGNAPIADIVGQIGGSMLPFAPGNLATRGAGKLLGEAGSLGGAVARGAAGGAAGGAATSAATDIADNRPVSGDAAAISALLGLPFGAAAGAAGYGMRAHGQNLRETTGLGQVERSGMGQTDVLHGVKASPKAEAIRREATDSLGPGREVDMLTRKLEEPMTKAGRRFQAEAERDIGQKKEAYFAATEDERRNIGPFVQKALELRGKGTTPDAQGLPLHGDQLKFLDKVIGETTTVDVVPAANGQALEKSYRAGSIDVPIEQAERYGVDVGRAVQSYTTRNGKPPGDDFLVRISPRELNPREMEAVKDKIDLALRMGDNPNRQELNPLMRSAREVRDAMPSGGPISDQMTASASTGTEEIPLRGFSAFQKGASDKTQDVVRTLESAGLPEKVPERLDAGQAQRFFSTAEGYRTPGRTPDADEALRKLARMGNVESGLEDVAGMRELGALQKRGKLPLQGIEVHSRFLDPLQWRLRLDPIFGGLGPGLSRGAPGAAAGARMDDESKRRMNLILGPLGPF